MSLSNSPRPLLPPEGGEVCEGKEGGCEEGGGGLGCCEGVLVLVLLVIGGGACVTG